MLDPTLFDRFTMGFSLSVHIVIAVIGVVLPVLIIISDYLWLRNNDNYYKVLSGRLTTAFVILFAIGTASGMLVAINLLFLWPNFMALVGQVAMSPVYLEVFAFFTESIFLTVYIFYRDVFRSRYARIIVMIPVAIGAAMSAVLITVLNSFMNTPVGFNIPVYLQNGTITNVDPFAAFSAPAVGIEVSHVLATSYFAGAGIFVAFFALMLLYDRDKKLRIYHTKALKVSFIVMVIGVVLSLITGVLSIEGLYSIQPEKFAAIEMNLNSTAHAPEIIGGIYQNGSISYALLVPDLQSILATGSPSGAVPGLNQFPRNTWPPLIIHVLFDFMVIAGACTGLFLSIVFLLFALKRKVFENGFTLKLLVLSGIISVVLLENGWMVDEIGRQPWIIYNVMTVSQAANTSLSIVPIATLIVAIYLLVIPLTYLALTRVFKERRLDKEL
ncbi:MAG: cytochrome ubiquinol oxidase subunit I [Candidatus Micrarchaeota archaeon]|nr:cytochrome ubiquinol oxidase subunit I [Candidatus Micrarchaeota archaeon]